MKITSTIKELLRDFKYFEFTSEKYSPFKIVYQLFKFRKI